jgi:RND family efflux transporter MFP subunit
MLMVATLGCRRAPAEDGETAAAAGPSAPKQVRCVPARARELRDRLEIHGTIAPLPDRDAQIAAQVSGRIIRVLVKEGDRVRPGQPLARIDDAALRDQSAQASAQLAKARAESHLAATSRTRVQRVFERGIAARQELDDATARLATAEANEAEAKASAGIINRQLERATVRTPLDGVVLRVLRRSGELVDGTAATPIVEVGDPSSLELVGTATAADLVQSKVGTPATIEVPALPTVRFTGVVVAVSPAVDRATGLGVVRVSLKLGRDVVPPVGVMATAHLSLGASRLATVVPSRALRAAIGVDAEVVICGADKRAHVVRVLRGLASGDETEIRVVVADAGSTPFGPGTMVASEPVLGIGDGDLIDVRHE